jgi:hypothetical protein
MMVENVHSRTYPAPSAELGRLLGTLSSKDDLVWPNEYWPPMVFKDGLTVGAKGGHNPIRYRVEECVPGKRVIFRFLSPSGFNGTHSFEVVPMGESEARLTHTIKMKIEGAAKITWPFLIRPLHDALLEDALSKVEAGLGLVPAPTRWSVWVKFVRWVMSGGKARAKYA